MNNKYKYLIIIVVLMLLSGLLIYYLYMKPEQFYINDNKKYHGEIERFSLKKIERFEDFPYVSGRFFRISRSDIQYVNLGGVLIYNEFGALINGDSSKWITTISSDWGDTKNNCLKITDSNKTRTLSNVKSLTPLSIPTASSSLFNYLKWDYNKPPALNNITHTKNSNNEWWEYDFGKDVNISGFELLPRSADDYTRYNNLKLSIYKDESTISHLKEPPEHTIVINMFANGIFPLEDSDIWKKPLKDITYFLILPPPTTTQPTTTQPTTTQPTTTQPTTTQPTTTQPTTTQPTTTQPTTTQPTTTQPTTTTQSGGTTTTQSGGTTTTQSGGTTTTQSGGTTTTPPSGGTTSTQQSGGTTTTTQSGGTTTTRNGGTTSTQTTYTASIPLISPSQTLALLNAGKSIDDLTENGMYRMLEKSPSTNIVQTHFNGTSNVYSPFLYYNKGLNEQFNSLPSGHGKEYYPYNQLSSKK